MHNNIKIDDYVTIVSKPKDIPKKGKEWSGNIRRKRSITRCGITHYPIVYNTFCFEFSTNILKLRKKGKIIKRKSMRFPTHLVPYRLYGYFDRSVCHIRRPLPKVHRCLGIKMLILSLFFVYFPVK